MNSPVEPPPRRLRDLDDAAFVRSLLGDDGNPFGGIPAPKGPEPPTTADGSTE